MALHSSLRQAHAGRPHYKRGIVTPLPLAGVFICRSVKLCSIPASFGLKIPGASDVSPPGYHRSASNQQCQPGTPTRQGARHIHPVFTLPEHPQTRSDQASCPAGSASQLSRACAPKKIALGAQKPHSANPFTSQKNKALSCRYYSHSAYPPSALGHKISCTLAVARFLAQRQATLYNVLEIKG